MSSQLCTYSRSVCQQNVCYLTRLAVDSKSGNTTLVYDSGLCRAWFMGRACRAREIFSKVRPRHGPGFSFTFEWPYLVWAINFNECRAWAANRDPCSALFGAGHRTCFSPSSVTCMQLQSALVCYQSSIYRRRSNVSSDFLFIYYLCCSILCCPCFSQ